MIHGAGLEALVVILLAVFPRLILLDIHGFLKKRINQNMNLRLLIATQIEVGVIYR